MKGRPPRYSEEFRREAARLVESGKPLKQIARDLGVSAATLPTWRRARPSSPTLTKELLNDGVFPTRAAASREIFEFVEIWYNRQRRHSTLGYRTPVEFEETLLQVS